MNNISKSLSSEEYDKYLLKNKQGRFKRIGDWKGLHKSTLHRCSDVECNRQWCPTPSKCLADDYYCPSCVLHHRNNMNRFSIARLRWTAEVPNTFYVYSIIDPFSNEELIKFGRTQNRNPDKRYSSQRRKYNMKLILSLRGKLITTTKIENWWKEVSKILKISSRFSDPSFHGSTETISHDPDILRALIEQSIKMNKNNQ